MSVRGRIQFSSKPTQKDLLGYNEQVQQQFDVTIGDDAGFTRPYWSRKNERDATYQIDQPQYLNLPEAPPEILATDVLSDRRSAVHVTQAARELSIAPAMSVTMTPATGVIPVSRRTSSIEIHAQVLSNVQGASDAKVHLQLPGGLDRGSERCRAAFFAGRGNAERGFRVSAPLVVAATDYTVQAIADYNGKEYREGYEVIARPDLETRYLYRAAAAKLEGIRVNVAAGLKVGYVMGSGDAIPEALGAGRREGADAGRGRIGVGEPGAVRHDCSGCAVGGVSNL